MIELRSGINRTRENSISKSPIWLTNTNDDTKEAIDVDKTNIEQDSAYYFDDSAE